MPTLLGALKWFCGGMLLGLVLLLASPAEASTDFMAYATKFCSARGGVKQASLLLGDTKDGKRRWYTIRIECWNGMKTALST